MNKIVFLTLLLCCCATTTQKKQKEYCNNKLQYDVYKYECGR